MTFRDFIKGKIFQAVILIAALVLLVVGFPKDKSTIDPSVKDQGAASISGFLGNTSSSSILDIR